MSVTYRLGIAATGRIDPAEGNRLSAPDPDAAETGHAYWSSYRGLHLFLARYESRLIRSSGPDERPKAVYRGWAAGDEEVIFTVEFS